MPLKVKIALAGNEKVGKTSLAMAYLNSSFEWEVPGNIDDTSKMLKIMDKDIELIIRDTRGGEDYERLTAMAFGAQDGFLLCFSLDNRKSFDDINDKWNDGTWRVKDLMNIPRPTPKNPLHYTWEHACMILVGLKQDKDTNVITRQEAEEAAKKIGAKKYIEVSSMTQHGMREAFDECLRGAIVSAEKAAGGEKGCCVIA